MRRVVRMIMSMTLVFALLAGSFGFSCLTVEAAGVGMLEEVPEVLRAEVVDIERESMPFTALSQCIISISGHDDGMYIDITTGASGRASVIGVKDIVVQRKFWYGWKTVATCSGGEINDRTMMAICITYENAVKDATYRITCTHYADVDGYTEGVNDTGEFVYTY